MGMEMEEGPAAPEEMQSILPWLIFSASKICGCPEPRQVWYYHFPLEMVLCSYTVIKAFKNELAERMMKKTHAFFSTFVGKATDFFKEAVKVLWNLGRNDPRKVIHAVKVGISITLVSMLYLLKPLSRGIGENAIWAVMTVVLVLEFTAGAMLCKGLNRGLGTLLAGSLAFLFEFIANESGKVFHAVFIGSAVFAIGALATYMRFIPSIKKNFDYGVVIFLLTFNLIIESSYRADDVIRIAHERLYTIAIGCGLCLLMSLLVFPNWSSQTLHDSTVVKFEGLAKSIEECVSAYFKESDCETELDESSEDSVYMGYKAVLDSKSNDETLALHASWEPRHSRHRFPWQQYVKVSTVLRQFSYTVVALHGCLKTEIQAPSRVRILFKVPCISVGTQVSKVLKELAQSIKTRTHCSPELLLDHLNKALHDLNKAIKAQPRIFLGSSSNNNNHHQTMVAFASATATQDNDSPQQTPVSLRKQMSKVAITSLEFSEALPFAAFTSLLVEMVAKLDQVIEEVVELGRVGKFKKYSGCDDRVVVSCEQPRMKTGFETSQGSTGTE